MSATSRSLHGFLAITTLVAFDTLSLGETVLAPVSGTRTGRAPGNRPCGRLVG